jgi:hypothetical protein
LARQSSTIRGHSHPTVEKQRERGVEEKREEKRQARASYSTAAITVSETQGCRMRSSLPPMVTYTT